MIILKYAVTPKNTSNLPTSELFRANILFGCRHLFVVFMPTHYSKLEQPECLENLYGIRAQQNRV